MTARWIDLIRAVWSGDSDMANGLINKFGNPKAWTKRYVADRVLCNTFKNAVKQGRSKVIEDLLKYGADVNTLVCSISRYTLLHEAVHTNQIEVAKLLINHGADVNAKSEEGHLPIVRAIENNNINMTRLLLSSGTEIKYCRDLLHLAVKRRSKEMFYMILSVSGIDVNTSDDKFGRTALHWTVIPEVSCDLGDEAAAVTSHVEIECEMAAAILSRGVNVNARCRMGKTALHNAVDYGHTGVVEILLKHEADVNSKDILFETPLHYTAVKGNKAIMRMLLKNGARINDESEFGKTALCIACAYNSKKVVATLLEFGANIDSRSMWASSPLQIAAQCGNLAIVKNLLKNFADIEFRDQDGRTALHIAVRNSWPDITRELLEHGSDINVTCNDGRTPFKDAFRFYSRPPKVLYVLNHHIVKMKALNMYVSPLYLKLMNIEKEYKDFYENCRWEVETSKDQKISDTNVTFHDLMTRDDKELALYARNRNIVKTLESGKYRKKFPIYGNMMYNNFKKGENRESLMNLSAKSLNFLLGFVLPELSSAKVLNNLSTKELKNLIKASP